LAILEFSVKGVTMVSSTASLSDTWRVGVLFSRTGLTAVTETEHFLGTALAIQEINQAG
jgi:ABC-type branched-subunit amino acid transport system substrate-binding protein